MAWIAAAITAASAIGGSIIQSNATSDAADASAAASQAAIGEQRRQFDIGQGNLRPWLQTGSSALGKLAKLYGLDTYTLPPPGSATALTPEQRLLAASSGQSVFSQPVPTGTYVPAGPSGDMSDFFASPDYNYRLTQAMKTLEARGATGVFGGLDSGALRKAEIGRAGDLASGEFGTYVNRLANIAGVGQTTAGQTAELGANNANQIANRLQNAGDTQASAYQAQGKNWGQTLSDLGGLGSGFLRNNPGLFSGGGGGGGAVGTGGVPDYGYSVGFA